MPGITRTKVVGYKQALVRLRDGETVRRFRWGYYRIGQDTLRFDAFKRLWNEHKIAVASRDKGDDVYSLREAKEL